MEANPNTLFVSSADELNNLTTKWSNSEAACQQSDPSGEAGLRIGICGATSTPLWLMEKVKEEIEKTQ